MTYLIASADHVAPTYLYSLLERETFFPDFTLIFTGTQLPFGADENDCQQPFDLCKEQDVRFDDNNISIRIEPVVSLFVLILYQTYLALLRNQLIKNICENTNLESIS